MDVDDLNCTIRLSLCVDAVESNCCGGLYCDACINTIDTCPVCRNDRFETHPARSIRKAIDRIEESCIHCDAPVQKGNIGDHLKVCPALAFCCAAQECSFRGTKEGFWKHLASVHEDDVFNFTTGKNVRTTFHNALQDANIQTDVTPQLDSNEGPLFGVVREVNPQCHNGQPISPRAPTVTNVTVNSLRRQSTVPTRPVLMTAKPVKIYCGGRLPKVCPCGHFIESSITSKWGCSKGICGPETGHKCPRCMVIDLKMRGLPTKGKIVDGVGMVVSLGNFGCYYGSSGSCGLGYRCNPCRAIDLLTQDSSGMYHQFLP